MFSAAGIIPGIIPQHHLNTQFLNNDCLKLASTCPHQVEQNQNIQHAFGVNILLPFHPDQILVRSRCFRCFEYFRNRFGIEYASFQKHQNDICTKLTFTSDHFQLTYVYQNDIKTSFISCCIEAEYAFLAALYFKPSGSVRPTQPTAQQGPVRDHLPGNDATNRYSPSTL